MHEQLHNNYTTTTTTTTTATGSNSKTSMMSGLDAAGLNVEQVSVAASNALGNIMMVPVASFFE
jgi:hypothetical protein